MFRPETIAVITLGLSWASATPAVAEPLYEPQTERIGAVELFGLAEAAERAGDLATAEHAYHALTDDPDLERRTEARFRLALLMADRLDRVREAAILLRRILDDKPGAVRVRLELARLHARMGNRSAAERELRAAEASDIPPEVERMVRFYRQSLNADKALGGSIEVAIAPDSNVNRATRSDTLGTIVGDFEIDQAAKARSGVGFALRGQAYGRATLSAGATLLLRGNVGASLYRGSRFNDVLTGVEAGPELRLGSGRLTLLAASNWRWYGNERYLRSLGGSAAWQQPLGPKAQLRIDVTVSVRDNFRNPLDEGFGYNGVISVDRAVTATTGGGVQLFHAREDARTPAYATTVNGASLYAYHELGRTTLVATGSYSRLCADAALALFPRRRMDDRFAASLAATFRSATLWGFAPLVRLRWERNRSTVELYDYHRRAVELGVTTAF